MYANDTLPDEMLTMAAKENSAIRQTCTPRDELGKPEKGDHPKSTQGETSSGHVELEASKTFLVL